MKAKKTDFQREVPVPFLLRIFAVMRLTFCPSQCFCFTLSLFSHAPAIYHTHLRSRIPKFERTRLSFSNVLSAMLHHLGVVQIPPFFLFLA